MKLSRGRISLTSLATGLPVVFLTSSGAKSGKPRTSPLLCIRESHLPLRGEHPHPGPASLPSREGQRGEGPFALIASNWGRKHYPAWYFNLKAHPRATCSMDGQARAYDAYEAAGEEYEQFWRIAVNTYLGYALYKQRVDNRRIPIMVMTPVKK